MVNEWLMLIMPPLDLPASAWLSPDTLAARPRISAFSDIDAKTTTQRLRGTLIAKGARGFDCRRGQVRSEV